MFHSITHRYTTSIHYDYDCLFAHSPDSKSCPSFVGRFIPLFLVAKECQSTSASPAVLPSARRKSERNILPCVHRFEWFLHDLTHFRSDWHCYNVKRKVASLQPLPLALFEERQKMRRFPLSPSSNSPRGQTGSHNNAEDLL